MLGLRADRGLLKGKRAAIDATTLEANAARGVRDSARKGLEKGQEVRLVLQGLGDGGEPHSGLLLVYHLDFHKK